MNRLRASRAAVSLAALLILASTGESWAQGALSAKLQPSGMIQVGKAGTELATIELNAHGPAWKHAPQATATAEVSALPNNAGKRFVGVLPIPGTDGGAIRYVQAVRTLAQGLGLEYDLEMTKAMKLDGVQLSICLPATGYAGKELAISPAGGEPQIVALPLEQQDQTFVLWTGEGAKVEVGRGTPEAISVELRAGADVVVQDLRKWGSPVFEIRFPAIMEDPGRDVAAGDKLHLDLKVTFATPLKLEGP